MATKNSIKSLFNFVLSHASLYSLHLSEEENRTANTLLANAWKDAGFDKESRPSFDAVFYRTTKPSIKKDGTRICRVTPAYRFEKVFAEFCNSEAMQVPTKAAKITEPKASKPRQTKAEKEAAQKKATEDALLARMAGMTEEERQALMSSRLKVEVAA